MRLLTNDRWRRQLAICIDEAMTSQHFSLLAFVFMPEHVHLLVLPQHEQARISALLKAIKRPYSARIKQLLQESPSTLLEKLTIRQREGVKTFRYWQEGPGYDRNLETASAIKAAIEYIHMNPVRRGFCQRTIDWKWSSARHFSELEFPIDQDLPQLTPLRSELLE